MNVKLVLKIILVFFVTNGALAQEDFLKKIKDYDLSQVINPDSISDDSFEMIARADPYGYIGDNYQRFQIHFTSFTKSGDNPLVYNVKGKTKVKDYVCSFTGTFEVIAAGYDDSLQDFVDPDYKALAIVSNITIHEDKSQKGSGIIKGTLVTDAFFDKDGKLKYNALMLMADGYANNQFTGTWTSNKNGVSKKCHWGDYRIPESGDLDYGAGEFSVNEKYRNNGWECYYDSYCCDPGLPKTKAARKKESEKWWL